MMDDLICATHCSMGRQVLDDSLVLGVWMETSNFDVLLLLPLWSDCGGPHSILDKIAFIEVKKLGDIHTGM